MRDPYTSTQGSEAGHHDSIGPAQVSVPDTMLTPFTGKQAGRSYAVQFGVGVCAVGAVLLLGYEMMQPPKPGAVVMNTRPAEVTVTVDGKALAAQTSPVTIDNLTPDVEHVIDVTKDGFKPVTQRVKVKEGEVANLAFVALEPLVIETGFSVDSVPTGATVLVDGKPLSQVTPVKVTDLPAGPHTIRIEHGFTHKPWEGPITATAGQVVEIPTPTLAQNTPAEAKKAERAAKLQALKDARAAKAAEKAAAKGITKPELIQ